MAMPKLPATTVALASPPKDASSTISFAFVYCSMNRI